MKPCPVVAGAFDFENSQILTLPHLILSGGGELILIGTCIMISNSGYIYS